MIVRELLTRLGFTVNPAGAQQYERSIQRISRHALTLQQNLGGAVGVLGSAFTLRSFGQMLDVWTRSGNQIRAAELASGMVARNMSEVNQIAIRAGAPLESIASLYARIMRSTEQIGGATEQQVARVTETVSKALQAGGATGAEVAAILVQLGQALSAGRLQGDELRSILENSAPLAKAIANEFGVAVGALKDMGAEGLLTSERVFKAILNASKDIDEQFASTATTIERSLTIFRNRLIEFMGTGDSAYGVTQKITDGILFLSNHLEVVAGAIMLLMIPALMSLVLWIGSTTAAFIGLTAAILANPFTWIAAAIIAIGLAIQDVYMWITGGKSLIGQWLGSWEHFTRRARYEWIIFRNSIKDGLDTIKGWFNTGVENLKNTWSELTAAFAPEIAAVAVFLWDPLVENFTKLVSDLKTLFTEFVGWLPGKIREIGGTISGIFSGIREKARGMFGDLPAQTPGEAGAAEAEALTEGERRRRMREGGEVTPPGFVPSDNYSPSSFRLPGSSLLDRPMPTPAVARGGVNVGDVNVKADINVPAGTTEEQTAQIMAGIERTIKDGIRRAVVSTLPSFPETV